MKTLYKVLACLILSVGFITQVTAQNRIFEKYNDMEDVEYICITQSMLKMIAPKDGKISLNGVNITGLTDGIKVLLIINSDNNKVCEQMRADIKTLRSDSKYELLVKIKDGSDKITTLMKNSNPDKELVMYIDEGDEQTFLVITGKLDDKIIQNILAQ